MIAQLAVMIAATKGQTASVSNFMPSTKSTEDDETENDPLAWFPGATEFAQQLAREKKETADENPDA